MDAAAAKNAQNAADRRLVEYFLVISTLEKNSKKKTKANGGNAPNKNKNNHNTGNGDMTFSDWRTESSGMIPTDGNNNSNSNNNLHDFYNQHIALQPKITARYPLIDHYDHPLQDENVIFFCHPSGSISLRTQPYMPKVPLSLCTCCLLLLVLLLLLR
jgi:hypothetical protein